VELIRFYGAEVIAITLNTQGLTEAQAKAWQGQYEAALSLPVVRPLEEGVGRIVKLVEKITGKAR
jgi:uncharacterized NAD-dependent epimerase/dehydratase family protein